MDIPVTPPSPKSEGIINILIAKAKISDPNVITVISMNLLFTKIPPFQNCYACFTINKSYHIVVKKSCDVQGKGEKILKVNNIVK